MLGEMMSNNDWSRGSTIIAICAAVVALISLVFAIYSEYFDREYKEASIRPNLLLSITPAFTISLENRGLGPAVIRSISVFLDKKCYSTKSFSHEEWDDVASEFIQRATNLLYGEVFKKAFKAEGQKSYPLVQASLPGVGTMWRPGDSVLLFGFQKVDADKLMKKLLEDGGDVEVEVLSEWQQVAKIIPFTIKYCSATGIYCDSTPNWHEDFCESFREHLDTWGDEPWQKRAFRIMNGRGN